VSVSDKDPIQDPPPGPDDTDVIPPPGSGQEIAPPPEEKAVTRVEAPEGMESTLPEDAPRIQLPQFEGPLDLLLYLIRKDKLEINDIPIAPITRQYMDYLQLMQQLNLDVAGEFMVMAATLIHIKSRMLVPANPAEAQGDEEQYEDPRAELARKLLEFQRYKEAALVLHQQAELRAATFTRPDSALPKFDDAGEEMLEAGLFDLIAAFKELLERRKLQVAHEVESGGISVEEAMEQLMAKIHEGQSVEFLDIFRELPSPGAMIATFLALLELIRLKRVKVYQRAIFGPIRVFRPVGPAEAAPQV
jgi:segregation and condensation protein A